MFASAIKGIGIYFFGGSGGRLSTTFVSGRAACIVTFSSIWKSTGNTALCGSGEKSIMAYSWKV
jgi:hypothetical protein